MTNSFARVPFFLLIASVFMVALGFWYLTGISARYFAITTKDHFLAFFRMITEFFNFI